MTADSPFSHDPESNPYQSPAEAGYRQPDAAVRKEIWRQSIASLIVSAVSLFCTLGIFLAPFAIYRGRKALRLIREYNVGHDSKGLATAGMIIGWTALGVHILLVLLYALWIAFSKRFN